MAAAKGVPEMPANLPDVNAPHQHMKPDSGCICLLSPTLIWALVEAIDAVLLW